MHDGLTGVEVGDGKQEGQGNENQRMIKMMARE